MTGYLARSLPRHHGPAAWDAILPKRNAAAPLQGDHSVDFAVIGGGFAGMTAARRLTQLHPDSKIAVLEAGHIAEGASGRNSGFMIDLPHDLSSDDYAGSGDDGTMIALNRKAIGFAGAAVEEYDIDRNFFDPAGKINGAATPAADAHNTTYARHLAGLGEDFTHLDTHEMQKMTGSSYYLSGLYTPGTVLLQPAGFMRGMADGLRQANVHIFENTPATGFSRAGSAWVITTPKGQVTAARIILTVNGHLESFGQARGRLMHVFLFAMMTAELDVDTRTRLGGQDRWGITPADPMGTTMRRIHTGQGGNRIITRSCAALRSGMQTTPADLRRAGRVMQRKFDRRFPGLAGMEMAYLWAGHLCLSLNGVAVMGEIDDGVFSGCVQNGLGTTRGILTGIGAAELACGVQSDITRHFTAEPQPTRLPPPLLRDSGANAILRWKEWKARAE